MYGRRSDKQQISINKEVSGQCAMGNFVGYWYTFANGVKKLRFETINQDLQAARYVKKKWLDQCI